MLREATYPPAAVNVLDVSSESVAAFQVFLYGRLWVFTEEIGRLELILVLRGVVGYRFISDVAAYRRKALA